MFAIIFVAFDLVTVFILLWALVFADIGDLGKIYMLMFLGILLAGVGYALKKEEIIWI
jgi:NADH:ubiquinone oxidoreductase subunit 3 (subunit A)